MIPSQPQKYANSAHFLLPTKSPTGAWNLVSPQAQFKTRTISDGRKKKNEGTTTEATNVSQCLTEKHTITSLSETLT